ncbi:hypothetical protein ACIRQY_07090 [Streptomyces sp. NPDC101490]|uniref:hypothetical protein n=1 Tax=Streptomyces sp. NPDC101490 TaxID=3366143 RepID=UPI0038307B5D
MRERTPNSVITGGGTTARFDGVSLTIERGDAVWTLPVQALAETSLTGRSTVRVEISGVLREDTGAAHGLGPAVELRAPNATAAGAFHDLLRAGISTARRAPDGAALVRMERRAPRPRPDGGTFQRAALVVAGLVPYAMVFVLLGLASPETNAALIAVSLSFSAVAGLVGGNVLWRVGRRARSLWLLRGRGIGVTGRVTGYVRIWSKGPHLWVFSRMAFRTVGGQELTEVPSVVTVWGLSNASLRGRAVDLVYDPEHPSRASRPLTFGFVLRTLVLASAGGLALSGAVFGVLFHLPG